MQVNGSLSKSVYDKFKSQLTYEEHLKFDFEYIKKTYWNMYKFNIKTIMEITTLNCVDINKFYEFYLNYVNSDMLDCSIWEEELEKYYCLPLKNIECVYNVEKVFYIVTMKYREFI